MRRIAIALAGLALAAAAVPSQAAPGDPTIFTAGFTFVTGDSALPAPLDSFTLDKTQPLFLTNVEPTLIVPHSLVSDDKVCPGTQTTCLVTAKVPRFQSAVITPGGTAAVTWSHSSKKVAGTFTFFCSVHPVGSPTPMTGTLVVV